MSDGGPTTNVIIVGGGFAGLGCARRLAGREGVHVTLIDQHNYHQFQPLLYQVATAQLSVGDVALSLRSAFHDAGNVDVKLAEVTGVDPAERSVTTADGTVFAGDVLVLAAGAQANFFNTPGADTHAFPLYCIADSIQLRNRVFGVFEDADRHPERLHQGALNFVIVGAGATGTEVAGALADMIHQTMPNEYHDLAVSAAQIHVVDRGQAVLNGFSEHAHTYAAKVLTHRGVQLRLGQGVQEVAEDHVKLADGTVINTHCVVWAGGLMAAAPAAASGLPRGRGGRIEVEPDLTVEGFPGVYVAGDIANVPGPDGSPLPQLGSVALQTGISVGDNILADIAGKPHRAFHYKDKGIMAMIGRGAAVAEVGAHRHELHGPVAFAAWLGVHAALMSGTRNKVDAFINWGWDYFSDTRGPQLVDQSAAASQIEWDDADAADIDVAGQASVPA